MSSADVVFKKSVNNLPASKADGTVYFKEDTGYMYIDVESGERVEVRYDLPIVTLPYETNSVSTGLSLSTLSHGFSIRIYGDRVPDTLDVDGTGSHSVYKQGSKVISGIDFGRGNNRLLTYTLILDGSLWKWVLNDTEDYASKDYVDSEVKSVIDKMTELMSSL